MENGFGIGDSNSGGGLAGWQIRAPHSPLLGKEPFPSGGPEPDPSGDDRRKSRREGLRNGRFRDTQIPRGRAQSAAREYALDQSFCRHFTGNGHSGSNRRRAGAARCARRNQSSPYDDRIVRLFCIRAIQILRADQTPWKRLSTLFAGGGHCDAGICLSRSAERDHGCSRSKSTAAIL